jgi:hypothetical protein
LALTLVLGLAACASIWGFTDFTEDDGGLAGDGAAEDGRSSDARCAESSLRCKGGGGE